VVADLALSSPNDFQTGFMLRRLPCREDAKDRLSPIRSKNRATSESGSGLLLTPSSDPHERDSGPRLAPRVRTPRRTWG